MLTRILLFLLSIGATVGLIYFADRPYPISKDVELPPVGRLLDPFSGFWRNAETAVATPGLSEKIDLPDLQAPVEVVFDDLGIPHIFAQNLHDVYLVQGFLTARDRLFQMDLVTRSAAGRLSEILGSRTLETDRLTRRQGMVWAAETNLEAWKKSPETMLQLEAYSAGVNAFVAQLPLAKRPVEFKLLNYAPEQWTPLKSSFVLENMCRMLSRTSSEEDATAALALLGAADFQSIFPLWNPKNQPIVQDFGQWKSGKNSSTAGKNSGETGSLDFDFLKNFENQDFKFGKPVSEKTPFRLRDGSNNWAISPKKSRSGKAILANDPHLGLSLPSVWYAVQLHTPEMNCMGVSLPGVPGVVIGFNENFSWGMTNGSQDVMDWYKIKWTDGSRSAYLVDGQPKPVQLRVETIRIKNQPDLLDTVRYTDWGPVTHDFQKDHPLADCAFFWSSHLAPAPEMLTSFYKLNTAKTVAEGQKGLENFDTPGQNFVMADRAGNIGIRTQGRFPARKDDAGRFVQDGSQSKNAWSGFIPNNLLPEWTNPSRGFVFSSNQTPVPPSYPFRLLGDYEDWRNRRIFSRLSKLDSATLDSMKIMQLDNRSTFATDALPLLLKLTDTTQLNPAERKIWDDLHGWQGDFEKDLTTPSLFQMWFDSCYHLTWDEMYAHSNADKPMLFPEYWRTLDLLDRDPKNKFFDVKNTPEKETAREVVTQSLKKIATAAAASMLTGDLAWGKFRGLKINHLTRIESFGRNDLLVGGHRLAPNAVDKSHGPSWRMIVEMGDSIRAVGVYPGGQSGNPGSPFYDNLLEAWAEGKYFDLQLLRSPDELKIPFSKTSFSPSKK